ncbi:Na+/H+ antiporter NhaC [Ligilactobacillus ceti]|uniref:Na+ H+ antiporter NhaC n=1 Tax=Ligilactobacillus ceti DSM 22408 TaxID=1122146 RepID=A0A0R2KNW2_9LACO|nr:Na+/H+ antiporter NhaC [Ligilactobacillus ceti]KRN89125.1 Na+ H+ antiporter NhaC [Ligilactobacillus ceti DSM 22408]
MTDNNKETPKIGVMESIIILILLLLILGYLIIGKQLTPHVPILLAFLLLMFYGKFRGFSWDTIFEGIIDGISPGIIPIVIFMMIGVLVATWLMSGTIPTIMYYGFQIISAKIFLPAVLIVCTLVAIASGSSLTTVSTMGIAFLGMGGILNINPAITAGAVISGAYFGENISPLSGTANLAAGIGEIDLYDHIKNLLKTDLIAFIIAMVLYFFIGRSAESVNLSAITEMQTSLKAGFWISPWTLLPVVLLLFLAWRKIPAVPSMMLGAVLAVIMGKIYNPGVTFKEISNMIMSGYVSNTGDKAVDALLSRGGLMSMMGAIALILLALALGGLLIKFNIIEVLIDRTKEAINTPFKVIFVTALSAMGVNFLVGEQFFSLILPGEAFKKSFDRLGVDRKYLSRTLADAGGSFNSLIPWGVSGTFILGTLKVSALEYLPYAFFPIIAPILTIIFGVMISKKTKAKNK